MEGSGLTIYCPEQESALFLAHGYIDCRIKIGRAYKVFFAGETPDKDRFLFEAELISIRYARVPGQIFNISFKGQESFYSDNSSLGYILYEVDKSLQEGSLSGREEYSG